MSWDDRSNWPSRAESALADLEARGIKTPKPVAAAVAVLRRVESVQPVEPVNTALRSAILAGAPAAELDVLVLAELGYTKLRSEWSQAKIDAAGAVLAAIERCAAEILPALRQQAEAAIENLRLVAELGPGITLDALVREGRAEDAKALADVAITAAALDSAYDYRDRFLVRGGGLRLSVNGVNASRWKDPEEAAAHARGNTPADRYLAGLRAGVELWFPTPGEAIKVAQAIADRRAAAAKRQAEAEFAVGSHAAFTT